MDYRRPIGLLGQSRGDQISENWSNAAVWDDKYLAPEILPVNALLIDEVIVVHHHHEELF